MNKIIELIELDLNHYLSTYERVKKIYEGSLNELELLQIDFEYKKALKKAGYQIEMKEIEIGLAYLIPYKIGV